MSHPHAPARLRLHDLQATRSLIALWVGLAVLDVGHIVGAAPMVQVGAMAALVAACSYAATKVVAVCVAGIGWLLVNGFVVHQLGQLGFVGAGDLTRAALLLGVALAAQEMGR